MKKETFAKQVMRVLDGMVKAGEVYKISVDGEEMFALADEVPAKAKKKPSPKVKCKPRVKCKPLLKVEAVVQTKNQKYVERAKKAVLTRQRNMMLKDLAKKEQYSARAKKAAITRKLNTLLRSLGAK